MRRNETHTIELLRAWQNAMLWETVNAKGQRKTAHDTVKAIPPRSFICTNQRGGKQ